MIHVTMIPNHEVMISFGGKQGVNLNYATVTHNLFQIKIFVNTLMLLLSPINEDPNNPSMHTKQK